MVAGTCATGENFKLTTAVCFLSMHTHCTRLYAPIMWQHMPEPGGSFTFSYFDIAIVNSISSCPHDSTDKSRQACDSLSVPYLKDMSEFVRVVVRECVCKCVGTERVQVDKLQTPTLREWESKRMWWWRGEAEQKGWRIEESRGEAEGRGLNLWENV